MIQPVDWSQIEVAIAAPRGWLQLVIIAAAVGVGWAADRSAWRALARKAGRAAPVAGSLARVVFPLTTWLVLGLAYLALRKGGPPIFINIAMPLMLALVAIRVIVYALRRLFPTATWHKASERTTSFTIWTLVVLHFTGVLPQMLTELDAIDIPIGKNGITLLSMIEGILVVLVTLVATLWISGFLEQRIMKASFDINLRVVLSKLLRALLLTVGVLISLQWIGFDLTLLSVFGGALGVGIGLGLQKLASNYVSGFAILFDRSIRMNDRIRIGDRSGVVTRLTARYVVVRDLDGSEAIVPNEMMVTQVVQRFPPAGEVRVPVQVKVASEADVDRALALMEEAARSVAGVETAANPPKALVRRFGKSGIVLELGIWLASADAVRTDGDTVRSAVNRAMLAALRANGVALA